VIRIAIFDCDGTLVDSQRRIVAAAEAAWIGEGRQPPDPEAVRRSVGLALPQALGRLAPDADEDELNALIEGFRQTFHHLSQDSAYDEPLYPGVVEALDALRSADVTLGVATGKGRRGLAHTLERHQLTDRFDILKTADDGPSKPHPKILNDAIAELGGSAEATVVLGDTSFDMAMARSAGVHALGVAWGYHAPSDLTEHGAMSILHDYSEAPAAVLELIGGAP
jgi:phosphoglycolate phosphatase